jgi:hypothetical protein
MGSPSLINGSQATTVQRQEVKRSSDSFDDAGFGTAALCPVIAVYFLSEPWLDPVRASLRPVVASPRSTAVFPPEALCYAKANARGS